MLYLYQPRVVEAGVCTVTQAQPLSGQLFPIGPKMKNRMQNVNPKQSQKASETMVAINLEWHEQREEKIARLTEAAYQAILQRGFRGSFIDLELSIWGAIRQAVEQDHCVEIEAV